jgi:hypothetical protein
MNRKAVISGFLPWLLIGIAVLVISVLTILLLKDKSIEFIEQIKNIFRGR